MGVVYEATQLDLHRRVAVKLLTSSYDPRDRVRLRTEAQAIAAVSHPNVVHLIEYRDDHEPPFLVMELLRGRTLATTLRAGALPEARAVQIAAQMLAGLSAAHDAGVIHRDIKPSNVFLAEAPGVGDVVKLLDFGVAKLLDGVSRTTAGVSVGTPAYMAPEQIIAGPVDPRTDIHAVGVCLFEMITGRRPWVGSITSLPTQIVAERAPRLDAVRPSVDLGLSTIVAKALEKDPQQRFASAAIMREALLDSIAKPVASLTGDPPKLGAAPPRPLLFVAGLLGVLLVGAVLTAVVLVANRRSVTIAATTPITPNTASSSSASSPSVATSSSVIVTAPPTPETPTTSSSPPLPKPRRPSPSAHSVDAGPAPVPRGPLTSATFSTQQYNDSRLGASELAAAKGSTAAIVACVNEGGDFGVTQVVIRITWTGSDGTPTPLVGWNTSGSGRNITPCVEKVVATWKLAKKPENVNQYIRLFFNLS